MIIEGVNCRKTRSIYYGIAISSSLGCLTSTLVQLWSLSCWEDKAMVVSLLFLATMFLIYAILVVRSFCVPIPTITKETRRIEKWSDATFYFMFLMFLQSYNTHLVQISIYTFGMLTGSLAVKQLNWPVQDVYIHHVVFTALLCCLSGYLGYQRPILPSYYVFAALVLLSYLVNFIMDQARPVTDFVHSPSRFRDLDT